MLFTVPLAYKATGTPKGKRNEVTTDFWEYVEIDIPEFSAESAPVAAEWMDDYPDGMYSTDRDAWRNVQPFPEGGMQTVRVKDDRFYLKHHAAETVAKQRDIFLDITSGGTFLNLPFIKYDLRDREHPVDRDAFREDKTFSTDFEDVIKTIREKASRFAVVGDQIYVLSSEPVIVEYSYRSENGGGIIPRIIPAHTVKRSWNCHRLDTYREVVEELNGFTKRYRDFAPITMDRAPKVYLPHVFNYDTHEANLVNAVRTSVDGISDYIRLHQVDPDYGIAYLSLKRALAIYDETGTAEALEEAARVMGENHPNESANRNLAAAYRNYQDRPFDTRDLVKTDFSPKP